MHLVGFTIETFTKLRKNIARTGRQEKCTQGFNGKPEERRHVEDLAADRSKILDEIGWEGAGWINLAQNTGKC